MIDQIESALITIPENLKKNEINEFIKNKLIEFFPSPELLQYDYTITGNKNDENILLSYVLMDIVQDNVYHPHLLIKHKKLKDGYYLIYYSGSTLEIDIKNGKVLKVEKFNSINMDLIKDDHIIIHDKSNSSKMNNISNKKIKLENLYKSCSNNLFINKKETKFKFIVILLTIIFILVAAGLKIYRDYSNTVIELNRIKEQYKTKESNIKKEVEEINQYNELLKETLVLESNIPPNLYNVISEIFNNSKETKIIDFIYSNNYLTIRAITKNSLDLVESINSSPMLNFKLNSTVTKDDYEIVNLSGEIKCQ